MWVRATGKLRVAVDTDCIISLFKPQEEMHLPMLRINEMYQEGKIDLYISAKTIVQLTRGGPPLEYAKSLLMLPNYPVGRIADQVGTWGEMAGTWNDAKENEELQEKVSALTKKSVNIRDRQIVIDSYRGKMDILLTNDHGLCGERQARNLKELLGISVMTPKEFLSSQL
jgi:hypothetical protein